MCPESDGDAFDPEDPLAGRWIRYWPWPLGGLEKVPLAEYAEASAEGRRVAEREEKERARLLYVGFTRARDHLVLAARVKGAKTKCGWLDALADGAGEPLLALPAGAADGAKVGLGIGTAKGKSLELAARVWRLGGAAAAADDDAADAPEEGMASTRQKPRWFARPPAAPTDEVRVAAAAAYGIAPSNAHTDWPELSMPTIGEIVKLPAAMPLDAKVAEHSVLGDAVHAFFATDVDGLTADERASRARGLLASAGLASVLRPEALVEASDRLRGFIDQRWPGAVWRREVALDARVTTTAGERRVAGIINLLLETPEGFVIFDHKTFPGRGEAAWRAKVVEFLPQFAAYAAALGRCRSGAIRAAWLHLPVSGALVELRFGA